MPKITKIESNNRLRRKLPSFIRLTLLYSILSRLLIKSLLNINVLREFYVRANIMV